MAQLLSLSLLIRIWGDREGGILGNLKMVPVPRRHEVYYQCTILSRDVFLVDQLFFDFVLIQKSSRVDRCRLYSLITIQIDSQWSGDIENQRPFSGQPGYCHTAS